MSTPEATRDHVIASRAELAAKRTELDKEEMRLNRLWNSTVSVNRLPVELLAEIFVTHVAVEFNTRYSLCILMLVCHHWHDVVLSTPELWSIIDVFGSTEVDWLKLCLSRAADVHLKVKLTTAPEEAVDLLAPHTHRIIELALEMYETGGDLEDDVVMTRDPLFNLLQRTMPALRWLAVSVSWGMEMDEFDYDLELTRERFPLLSSLYLRQVTLPRDLQLYRGLHQLSIDRCSPAAGISLDDFFDVLSAMPELVRLQISETLDAFVSHPGDDRRAPWRDPVRLPQLISCRIQDEYPDEISTFLAHLVLPATVELHVKASIGEDTQDDIVETMQHTLPINSIENLSVLLKMRSVDMVMEGSQYSMKASVDLPNEGALSPSRPAQVVYSLSSTAIRTWQTSLAIGLRDLTRVFYRAVLKRLSVSGDHSSIRTTAEWEHVFRLFLALSDLELKGQGLATQMWVALRTTSIALDGGRPEGVWVLPTVKTVTVSGKEMRASREFFSEMLSCLRHRAELGSRLDTLMLSLSHAQEGPESYEVMKRTYLPQLQGLVGTVIYDAVRSEETL